MKYFESTNEDIWKVWDDTKVKNGSFIVITTNGFIKKDRTAVMGAGIARTASMKFPDLRASIGEKLIQCGNVPFINIEKQMITLPTKDNWTEPSKIDLIESGLKIIVRMADELRIKSILLPRPGCGNGHLDWLSEVKPICDAILDDTFMVFSKNIWQQTYNNQTIP
jgi:hypothetical protein